MNRQLYLDTIPNELKTREHWVLHRQKIPYQINGRRAKSTDPTTWATFSDVVEAYHQGEYDGIGFCLPPDENVAEERILWAWDLDDAIDGETKEYKVWSNADGTPAPVQPRQIVESLASYTEITPSGCGLRVFVWMDRHVPGGKKFEYGTRDEKTGKRPGVEIYSYGRYLTVTGNVWSAAQ